MALQSNITTESGISVNNAYSRVEKVKLTSKNSISFDLASYVASDKTPAFHRTNYLASYDLSGDNPIRQAYIYVKSLPEFAESNDV